MKKKAKKSTRIAANKMAQAIYDEQTREYNAAQMEAVLFGVGFIAIDPDGGMKHVPMSAIAGIVNAN